MNQVRSTKINNIGRISRVLLWLLTPFNIFIYIGVFFSIMFFCFVPSGNLSCTDLIIALLDNEKLIELIKDKGLLLSSRIFSVACLVYIFVPLIFLLRHLKQVLQCFYNGDIFNSTALAHARKAYKINLFIVISSIAFNLFFAVYVMSIEAHFEIDYLANWASGAANGLIEVAISTLLIWAFELGTDVSTEAELTI